MPVLEGQVLGPRISMGGREARYWDIRRQRVPPRCPQEGRCCVEQWGRERLGPRPACPVSYKGPHSCRWKASGTTCSGAFRTRAPSAALRPWGGRLLSEETLGPFDRSSLPSKAAVISLT